MHKVSTVIPCYNYARFLTGAIESALGQTLPPHEIIVVDDGSTDRPDQVVETFGSSVRYIRTENRGVSSARNTGVEAATGDLVAFLDADDRWLPGKLERQIPLFADSNVALTHTGSRVFDHDTGATKVEIQAEPSLTFHDLLQNCSLSLPSTVVRKDVFREVGGFDPKLSNAADWDLWLRIALKYRVAAVPDVLVEYREHRASMSRGNEAKQFRESLLVVARGAQHHQNCPACATAVRHARHRLPMLYYGVSASAARQHARNGEYWESFRRRISPFWHHPPLFLAIPEIVRDSLLARKELHRILAEQARSGARSSRQSAQEILTCRNARRFEVTIPKA